MSLLHLSRRGVQHARPFAVPRSGALGPQALRAARRVHDTAKDSVHETAADGTQATSFVQQEASRDNQGWLGRKGLGRFEAGRLKPSLIQKRGVDVLHDPWFNKGVRFPNRERDRLGIRGLLPAVVLTTRLQVARFLDQFNAAPDDWAKWQMLTSLHDRNETLFYKVVSENIEQMAPIVYTPTVGHACLQYSNSFRRPRGMFFSSEDRGEMSAMLFNWPSDEVDVVVVTDGSRILGLGDLGAQGMGISVGKLVLYVAGGGIVPVRTLPAMIDVGTDNEALRADPIYVGLSQPRLTGDEYYAVIDEFMAAIYNRYPNAMVQFEDFQTAHASTLLDRYRHKYRCFNDDIQGTGGVALGAMLSSLRALGQPFEALPKQRFVVAGAGSAGIGIVDTLVMAMTTMYGATEQEARDCFWVCDHRGLLGEGRDDLTEEQAEYQRSDTGGGMSLEDTVTLVKPTVLLGVSGAGNIFSTKILETMAANNEKPLIFPMSNPTDKAECTALQAFEATDGRCIFGSGSPFKPVTLTSGAVCKPNQANNMYIFPGLGLGVVLCKARIISDKMLLAASITLAEYPSEEQIQAGEIFPEISKILEVSVKVAAAVIETARDEDLLDRKMARQFDGLTRDEIEEGVARRQWNPRYHPLVYESATSFNADSVHNPHEAWPKSKVNKSTEIKN